MVYLEDPHWTPQLQVLQEPESIKIKESQATEIPRKDPLIAYSWDKVAYLGAFLVLVSIIILIGHINSRLEHALVFAFILSIIFIAFLITL